jgi:VanZ family protein
MTHAPADRAKNTRNAAVRPHNFSGILGPPRLWIPVVGYCAGIFYLSSLSMPPGPVDIIPDKIAHVILYAGLSILVSRYLSNLYGLSAFAVCAWAAIFCLIYGITDEVHQFFVEGRNAEIGDVIADFVGGIVGGSLYILFVLTHVESDAKQSACAPPRRPK